MNAPATIEKRKPLTRIEVIQLMLDQDGRCGCGCGEKLEPLKEGVIDEHFIPLEQTGKNALTNRRLYRKPCATTKTKKDARDTAKCKRLAGETGNAPKRQIHNRGFSQTLTKGFDGKVRERQQKDSAR